MFILNKIFKFLKEQLIAKEAKNSVKSMLEMDF